MILSIILLFFIIGITLLSKSQYFHYYMYYIFPIYRNTIGRIMNIIPYSIFQWLVPLMVIGLIYFLFKNRKVVIPYLLSIFLIYTLSCGAIYNRTDLQESHKDITQEQIDALATLLMNKVNELNYEPLDQNEIIDLSSTIMSNYEGGYFPNPKKVIGSSIMSDLGIGGIYSPFTIEANVNVDMPNCILPFTALHELSHLAGYMKEEQANFNAYKACIESDISYFQYSAYRYAINSIAGKTTITITVPEYFYNDMIQCNEYWKEHEGTLTDVEDTINDTYLKANGDQGTVSYSQLVYDLIEYYQL